MNLKELYYQDPYQVEFEAEVLSCIKKDNYFEVILDKTCFYPEGGGQPADLGKINGIVVEDVQEVEGTIIHYLKEELQPKATVKGIIDWQRRFDHMQNHTGEHIVSGLIHQAFGYDNIGFHMGHVIQIDFSGKLTWEDLMQIEEKANDIIQKNLPIQEIVLAKDNGEYEYRSKLEIEDTLRLIKIEDVDCCACCGTHVGHTGEIGLIKILSVEKHPQGTRVEMLSGKRAMSYLRSIYDENHAISTKLSAKANETSQAVEKLQAQLIQSEQASKAMQQAFLELKKEILHNDEGVILEFFPEIDRHLLVKVANDILQKEEIKVVSFIFAEKEKYSYMILSEDIDLKERIQVINKKLSGRGGGQSNFVQGSFQATKEEIERVLNEELK